MPSPGVIGAESTDAGLFLATWHRRDLGGYTPHSTTHTALTHPREPWARDLAVVWGVRMTLGHRKQDWRRGFQQPKRLCPLKVARELVPWGPWSPYIDQQKGSMRGLVSSSCLPGTVSPHPLLLSLSTPFPLYFVTLVPCLPSTTHSALALVEPPLWGWAG